MSRKGTKTRRIFLALSALATLISAVFAISLCQVSIAGAEADRHFQECSNCPKMVAIPGGTFVMGSSPSEQGHFDNEGPEHRVTVGAFALSETEVTNQAFLTFLRATGYQPVPCEPLLQLTWHSRGHGVADTPGNADPPLWPATCLSWDDAQAYIAWLNQQVHDLPSAKGRRHGPYRLPTEAEWEYAARAGTTTSRWWGNALGKGYANCEGCGTSWGGHLIAPVYSFGPNRFGLYDMLGNVWQWVSDCWHDSYVGAPKDGSSWTEDGCSKRVLRGGSWANLPIYVRSAARLGANARGGDEDWSNYASIRVARDLP